MFGSIKAPAAGAQTRNMTIKPLRILGGRGVGKGAKALNRSKVTRISGAEALGASRLYQI